MRILLIVTLAASAFAADKLKEYKPGWLNMFSQEQDVQLGKESADEVRKTMPVVNNAELTGYVNRIGARLAKSKRAGGYPYTFEVINDPSINAFALPGGPMFVHTGLLASLDNESQLAGVLAHEMSHVSLRHGTSNVSKANLVQLPAMLAGTALGNKGGIWGTLGQLGIGLGAQSMLLKYSRNAETEADLNGAQIMNDAGYDPTQMALFFQKLDGGAGGGGGDNSKLANFMSDHPTPGNRVKYVNDQNKLLPKKSYSEPEASALPRVKQIVAGLPPPPKPVQPAAGAAAPGGQGGATPDPRPSGKYRAHQGSGFQLNYPDNWEVFGDPNSPSVTIAPRSTLVQGQNGQVEIAYGMLTSYYFPSDNKGNLQRDTAALVKQMGDSQVKATGNAKTVKVAGQNALLTPMESQSPYQGQREIDMLLTVARPEALFYIVFIAPESEWAGTQKAFDAVVASLQFTK
ncbi:MAG: M48 family metallopeptidase [Bryobacteraceae bacterium]